MDKKKKRASFSLEADPPKSPVKSKVSESDANLQQVVEVIVEEQPGNKHAPQVNIVIPQSVVSETVIDRDVKAAVEHLPNVIDDGSDDEIELTPSKQQMLTEVVASDEQIDADMVEDESVVTASATASGDTVVVTEDLEETEEYRLPRSTGRTVGLEPESNLVEETVGNQVTEEIEESDSLVAPKSVPPIKIHNPELESDSSEQKNRESAVAELFSGNGNGSMPEITVHKQRQTKGVILWAITMIAIALGVGGGLVVFTTRSNQPDETTPPAAVVASPAPSPTVAVPVTPTVAPTALKRSDIRIQVLNGGGVPGAGSRMKSLLEEKGYRVVETKNAESYTYEMTEIEAKASSADAITLLTADLKTEYELGDTATNLPASSTFDVRVIVGENE